MEYLDLELAWFCIEDSATLESYPVLAVPLGLVMDNKDFMDNWTCTAAVTIMLNTRFHGKMRDGEVYEHVQ